MMDVHHLFYHDPQPVPLSDFNKDSVTCLRESCQQSVQLLFHELFNLPTRKDDEGSIIATLPETTINYLPREKPLPKPKAPTKWELFAQAKGIKKKKKSRMVWDDQSKEWKPRWGYKKANDEMGDWLIPVKEKDQKFIHKSSTSDLIEMSNRQKKKKDNSESIEGEVDPWTQRLQEKKERVEKQTKQQKANKKRSSMKDTSSTLPGGMSLALNQSVNRSTLTKGKKKGTEASTMPSLGDTKSQLKDALIATKFATASYGRFQKQVANEPKKNLPQKREPVVSKDFAGESELNKKVYDKIFKETQSININKAINTEKVKSETENRKRKLSQGELSKKQSKGKKRQRK